MITRYLILFIIMSCSTANAQFYKNFDIEISHGWMKSFNKKAYVSESIPFSSSIIENENPLWTDAFSISLGYTISKYHNIRIVSRRGKVGSSLTGLFSTFDDHGISASFTLQNNPQIIEYSSIGLHYLFLLPFDEDHFIFELGVSSQKNSIKDLMIFAPGILESNYNISTSFGLKHALFEFMDLVPKVTLINSFENDEMFHVNPTSRFVPIQLGFELGIRIKV